MISRKKGIFVSRSRVTPCSRGQSPFLADGRPILLTFSWQLMQRLSISSTTLTRSSSAGCSSSPKFIPRTCLPMAAKRSFSSLRARSVLRYSFVAWSAMFNQGEIILRNCCELFGKVKLLAALPLPRDLKEFCLNCQLPFSRGKYHFRFDAIEWEIVKVYETRSRTYRSLTMI